MVRLHISRQAENINFRKHIYSAVKVPCKQPDSPSAKKHGEGCIQDVLFAKQPSTKRNRLETFSMICLLYTYHTDKAIPVGYNYRDQ
jgi:hypothetical protein